jgi:tRNA A37 threonylcarbamoyladenosine synthetase subunit TsaC/SUA5/YrdC
VIVGVEGVRDALGRGEAVVLPNPVPLTHVVTATTPAAVNAAKGRPVDQAVAVWAHSPGVVTEIMSATTLAPAAATLAHRLLGDEHVTLLVPMSPSVPDWLAPATRDGWALLFGARWPPVRPVLDSFPVLYVSSANRTGHQPVASTAAALEMFPPGTPVLDLADRGRAEPVRRATTTLRLHPDGSLDLHRRGAQDHPHRDTTAYLDHLRSRHVES